LDLEREAESLDWAVAAAIFKAGHVRLIHSGLDWEALDTLRHPLPCLFLDTDGVPHVVVRILAAGAAHPFAPETTLAQAAVVLAARDDQTGEISLSLQDAQDTALWWPGDVIGFEEIPREAAVRREFTLGWFFSQIFRRRGLAAAIVLTIIVVHAAGLAIPLFFQTVVDKVLVNETRTTLNALTVGIVVVIVFEAFQKFFRDYLISHLAAKIDILTATKTFAHLVRLPIGFFQRNTAGVITNNIQQADQIREFITGRVLGAMIELTAVFVFVPVLWIFYSPTLTWIVLATGLVMTLIIALLIGPYFRQLRILYETEGERKTLLVETINGISTVKSIGMEQRRIRSWNAASVTAVNAGFRMRRISAVGGSVVEAVEQIGSIVVLFVGVTMVLEGSLSVGALIAFRMLSGQVTEPLRGIAELVHEFQRVRLSAEMLGRVMTEAPERQGGNPLPARSGTGHIQFDNVTFHFPNRHKAALQNVSFEIMPGECIGITGRSGSGKSTIARLIQGLYDPQAGEVRVDGLDVRKWDLHALRSMMSVVLQENFLFRGTVAENISMATPTAGLHEIEAAAALAGAQEFIEKLPEGLREQIAENGANFSGGQRQRLAIARALLRHHSILVFDEATSALDVESEQAIQENMGQITHGKTTLIIAHRLSTLSITDRIMVMDEGRLIDFRPLHDLLDPDTGCTIFRDMWQRQVGEAAA
ncbi:MAG: peptidase domain-containing ABC transporter, partial [Rhodobacterales bacterium]|nr:peptidase domain-containing ABC transporter [Rhodobacterales bacterium]MDX5412079.1 peptidase domain-containing ABC transporter [Rhodobacterales bacterium]